MNESTNTEVATIKKLDKDVIKTTYKTGVSVEIQHAKEIDNIYLDLSKGEPVYSIVHAVGIHSNMTNEAQKFFSKENGMVQKINGAGIILSNLPIRLLARFYIQFYKPKYPTKIFNTEQDAIKWFEELRVKNQKVELQNERVN